MCTNSTYKANIKCKYLCVADACFLRLPPFIRQKFNNFHVQGQCKCEKKKKPTAGLYFILNPQGPMFHMDWILIELIARSCYKH